MVKFNASYNKFPHPSHFISYSVMRISWNLKGKKKHAQWRRGFNPSIRYYLLVNYYNCQISTYAINQNQIRPFPSSSGYNRLGTIFSLVRVPRAYNVFKATNSFDIAQKATYLDWRHAMSIIFSTCTASNLFLYRTRLSSASYHQLPPRIRRRIFWRTIKSYLRDVRSTLCVLEFIIFFMRYIVQTYCFSLFVIFPLLSRLENKTQKTVETK